MLTNEKTLARAALPGARPDDLERSIGYLVGDVSRLFKKLFDRRVQGLELTRSQWLVLAHLQRGQGLTQSQLASRLEIERPTLGRLIDRLAVKGWVERRPDRADRRTNRLHLTAAALPVIAKMQQLAAEVVADALDGVAEDEVERMTEQLMLIKENLSARFGQSENGDDRTSSGPPGGDGDDGAA